ncbi:hypothetical protein [Plantactinospora sp. WMMB782]|uniref:hypothetical protein n=1 Tax=Plantactinospora sp. WMMB782 TaxID=3404121 RepID=UPI003B945486
MSEYDTAPSKPDFERRPADHPHTDPDDGRSECDRCGKFVWPAIHSCKGVPVTVAARARWDAAHAVEPVTAPNPADVEQWSATINTAADILREYIARESPDLVPLLFNADYEGMAMALAEAGRLLPSDTDTRTEYAAKVVWDTGDVTFWESDRGRAEDVVAFHAKRRAEGPHGIASAEVVQRTVITSTGPWRPVPSTPTKES